MLETICDRCDSLPWEWVYYKLYFVELIMIKKMLIKVCYFY